MQRVSVEVVNVHVLPLDVNVILMFVAIAGSGNFTIKCEMSS